MLITKRIARNSTINFIIRLYLIILNNNIVFDVIDRAKV